MDGLDSIRFEQAKKSVLGSAGGEAGFPAAPPSKGVGTLREKTLHLVLKRYFEPYENNHEIHLGSFIADIVGERGVIEIQTGSFQSLRKKLETLLPFARVTVVYPIAQTKWLYWIDECTGEISGGRKSPKRGDVFDAFYEMYKIKGLLSHQNLRLCLVLLEMEEYRRLNGWSKDGKKGSTRFERIPLRLIGEVYMGGEEGYGKMIPTPLPELFCAKDFAAAARLTPSGARTALNVLFHVRSVERVGKRGNAYLYRRANSAAPL